MSPSEHAAAPQQPTPEQRLTADLSSTNHRRVARVMSEVMIQEVAENPKLGGEDVASTLRKLRDVVWAPMEGKDSIALDGDGTDRIFKKIMEDVPPMRVPQLIEAYTRMGHIYEIAGLQARQNYFDECRTKNKPIPGGAQEMLDVFTHSKRNNVREMVEALNKPVFEVISTMHPTNVNSLASMKLQRAIGDEAAAVAAGKKEGLGDLRKLMADYVAEPINQQRDGKDGHFTVRDETEIMLYHMGNIYDDMPRSYNGFDNTLRKASDGESYDPLTLNLNLRLGSWGSSGDKDGNDSVTAETTLEAIAMHKAGIMHRYHESLSAMGEIKDPALKAWQQNIQKWDEQLQELVVDAGKVRAEQFNLPTAAAREAHDKAFDDVSKKLAEISPSKQEFEQTLENAYRNGSEDDKPELLNMVRRVRVFGFTFGKIEYRETADRYSDAVGALITDDVLEKTQFGDRESYKGLDDVLKLSVLNDLFKPADPANLQAGRHVDAMLTPEKKQWLIENGAGREYDPSNPLPITYHTIKRMELARDHPEMIHDNVLAECTGATRLMEAKLLQSMIPANDKGQKTLMGIIPLFEEKESITQVHAIMKAAYDQPVYQQHLDELAAKRNQPKTQQVQIAHSDNARRAGFAAARGFIHQAHRDFRALNQQYGIETQFFQGGSLSDAYRNGVRAISGMVNAFGLHDFAKFTFQGGDMLNYFNQANSIERIITRAFVHQSVKCAGLSENMERLQGPSVPGHKLRNGANSFDPVIDEVVRNALAKAYDDYSDNDFQKDKIGTLMAHLHYNDETEAQNRGSRAAKRKKAGPVFAKVESVQADAVQPVPIKDIRTIAFSESMSQNAIVPSWVGAGSLEKYLTEAVLEKIHELEAKPQLSHDDHNFLSTFEAFRGVKNVEEAPPIGTFLPVFRVYSPTFRNVVDGMSFAIALTDLANPGGNKKAINEMAYFGRLKNDFLNAGTSMLHAALDEPNAQLDQFEAARDMPTFDERKALTDMKNMVQDTLPLLKGTIRDKEGYRRFLIFAKQNLPLYEEGMQADDATKHLRIVAHSGLDTVTHGRYLGADDPFYGKAVYSQAVGQSK